MNWRKPIIYLLLYLSGSKISRNLKEIEKVEKFSEQEKRNYQNKKLKKILLHSYKSVPYYRKVLMDAGVVDDQERIKLKNFNKISVLTKDIIRKEGKNLYSKDYKKRGFYKNSSGGSTGEPVQFIQDKNYCDWNIANKIFIKLRAGQKIGEKELRFWGSERDLLKGKESFKLRARNWLYNRKEFNTFRMSERKMFKYVEDWNEFEPNWVESYVQSMYEFALFVERENLKIYSPKNGILTSAGNLYPDMKKTIEKVFSCRVYNRYGSREVGDMAFGKSFLNLSYWNHKLDIVGNKTGDIWATTLNNYSMPLINYKIGDIAVLGKNEFELEKIVGRGMEVFKTKEGQIIPGEFFIHFIGVVHNNNSIVKFQAIQKDYDQILIKVVVRNEKKFKEIKKDIENSIKKEMGGVGIKWKEVKKILPTKSGKYLYTISEVK